MMPEWCVAARRRAKCEKHWKSSTTLLAGCEVTVETKEDIQHRCAVIDRSIVWYGNINFLSYSAKDANALRFESPDIAGELLESWMDDGNFEQMRIEL